MYNTDKTPIGLAYEKSMKLVWWFGIGLVAAVTIIVLQGVAIYKMLPLKEVKPYYVTIAEQGNTHYYKIKPADNLTSSQLYELTREYLKNYVINRQTVDDVTEIPRFRKVKAQSSEKVFGKFRNEFQRFKQAMPTVNRRIEIIRDLKLEPFFHQIEFRTIDKDEDGRTATREWVVNMKYTLAGYNAPEIKIPAEEMESSPNPLGITITAYDFQQRQGK